MSHAARPPHRRSLASPGSRLIAVLCAVLAAETHAFSKTLAAGTDVSGLPEAPAAHARPQVRVLEARDDGLRLELTVPDITIETISLPQGSFQVVEIPGGEPAGRPGEPMLPVYARMLAVPDRADVEVRVLDQQSGDPVDLAGKRVLPMPADDGSALACEETAYARDDWGDRPFVAGGEPAILRGLRVVPITFAPVQYNPARSIVRQVRRLEVEVSFRGTDGGNPRTGRAVPLSPSFARLCDALLINAPPAAALDGPSADRGAAGERSAKTAGGCLPGTWLLICPDDPEVVSRLTPLVEWRKRKGYPVVVATTTTTGTTKEQIQAYIQNAYDTWPSPPEFVVLAGDCLGAYVIPTWNENVSSYHGEGDHPYVLLEGNDILADAHVGRLSFQTLGELETIVAKITRYESQPYTEDPSWFTRACLTGDPYASGISTVHTMQWIKSRLRELAYTEIDTVFDTPFVSGMMTALNRGDTVFAYRGIYGMSGWSNTHTLTLANGWKLPFCVIITCDTGSFQGGTSRSEVFLRAGSPTNPRGGVGCVGTATTGTHTRFNNCYTMGAYWGMLYHDAWEMGAAHSWGKLNLWLNYSFLESSAVVRFSYWNNLMGDPAAEVWTAMPQPLAVTHPPVIPVGSNLFPVDVSDQGQPCAGALVCLRQPGPVEVQAVGYTDAAGHLDLQIPPLSAGPVQVTVTRHDRLPYLADVSTSLQPFVGLQSFTLDDDPLDGSQGNGDGAANPGETIELRVQLRNHGAQTATGVTCRLRADDPDVPVLDEIETFGDIAPSGVAWCAEDFDVSVPLWSWHGRTLRFLLEVRSGPDAWTSLLEVPVTAAEMVLDLLQAQDSGGDGRLDPGDTGALTLRLRNAGGAAVVSPAATLASLSEHVVVTDASAIYPSIGPGETGENSPDPFAVAIHPGCPAGYAAPMQVMLEAAEGGWTVTPFTLPLGELNAFDPTGPDQYGYWAYDDTDTGYPEAPVYAWREIAPAAGGPGEHVVLGDFGDEQDKSRTVSLPFPFTYYGETYTSATICSNGWIQMGATWLTDYRNWVLPSPGGPNGAIAVYWDDLVEVAATSAHVYQHYDAAEHLWIVEWYRLRNAAHPQATETFQAIFHDPAWYPTETGDGVIVFQYQSIANVDDLDGYSTVGIEKPDNSDGLTYLYALNYGPSQAPLVSGRAIRFVPNREAPAGVVAGEPGGSGFDRALRNPFPRGGGLRFSLASAGGTSLGIYDAQGRQVRRLVRATLPAGSHTAAWDGRDDRGRALPAGVYFARLESAGGVEARKLVLAK